MKKLLLFLLLANCTLFAQQPYYSDVNLNLTGTALRDELATKVSSTHTTNLSYTPGVWEACKITDLDPDDNTNSNVLLIYGYSDSDGNYVTDRTRSKNLNGGSAGTEWNREHTYAKSLGSPNLGTSGPGADAHHLRASDITLNGNRSSTKFATGSGNAGNQNGGWYPGDEWKGDVARMMMYMYLRYGNQCYPTGVANGTTNAVDSRMVDLLLQWNAEDPVSAYEDQRNAHHDSSHQYAQGNRNPFIDNPNLATQIWGGPVAEDRWNVTPDTQNPTAPTNLVASNITNTTVDLNWTASTDDIGVTNYEIFVDGNLYDTSATNSATLTGLTQNTSYAITVFAKDAAGNTSTVSNTENITTDNFIDTEAPTAIADLTASNITSSTVDLNWTASTDNAAVTSYEIFQDGISIGSSATNSYSVTGLTPETSYNFTVFAKDAAGNTSLVSNTEVVTTTATPSVCTSETFTNMPANSSSYSTRSWTGDDGGTWTATNARTDQTVNGRAIVTRNGIITAPLNVPNGIESFTVTTKRVFSGGTGTYNLKVNGTVVGAIPYSDVAQTTTIPGINLTGNISITLDRASGSTSDRVGFDDLSWECYSSSASTEDFVEDLFSIYPNPTRNGNVTISLKNDIEINSLKLYNFAGQLIKSQNKPVKRNGKIELTAIPSGIYILKIQSDNSISTKRLVVE